MVHYCVVMQRLRAILFFLLPLLALGTGAFRADASPFDISGRVVKVLPLFLDTNNEVATSPSLFDRDAYQARLRRHSYEISGIRFDVDLRAHNAHGAKLTLRLELRGVGAAGMPTQVDLAAAVRPRFLHHWTSLTLNGPAYKQFGALAAWRATLWNGSQLLSEQKSFLWQL
jgi:hypothetical protein